MVNKYVAPKCTSGYASNVKKQISKFRFPLKRAELNMQWICFVNGRDWPATKHTVLLVQEPATKVFTPFLTKGLTT